jgi:hypothetical protein
MNIRRFIHFLGSKWWRVLIITVVNLASFTLLFSLEQRFQTLTGQPVYDTQNNLNHATLLEQLPLYEGEAREAYYIFAAYDFILPLIAALFVAVVISWLLQHNPTTLAKRLQDWNLPLLAFVGTVFDWLENVSLIAVIEYGASVPEIWLNAAILFKRLKLAMLSLSGTTLMVILIFTVAASLYQFWQRRSERTSKLSIGRKKA